MFEPVETDQQGPILPTHSPDGVDLTLIRYFLDLTPAQRLETASNAARFIWQVRNARATRPKGDPQETR
ncbi:MAG: hypothetical protein U0793_24470 [Gemmataceae bacterium]